MKLMHMPKWRVWWSIANRLWLDIGDKRLPLIAAGIAFYGMLALFPAIAAIIALWGLIGDPGSLLPQMDNFRAIMPTEAYTIVGDQITALALADQGTLGWATGLSVALALWSTRAGVAALMQGMNAVYGERSRAGLAQYYYAYMLTISLILVALVAIGAIVIAPVIMSFVPLGKLAGLALDIVRWTLAIAVLMAGASIVYRYGPNRRNARIAWVTPGAIMAVGLWAIASVGFSIYLSEFGNYNEVYGSIGAVIALMMWLFISGFLLLLGAALNAELERHTKPDSTVGPDLPLGERGAEAADTFVDLDKKG
ncbi:YihY/virulence factor BrkB family protein [Jannaschia sp. 2305UL9-9]|uniref:YihY/virulence factor BrkB family protein n=1 Tax=Jannaschia sp. 2305UL9-9 TaxID=3121638 RepID=UPI0035299111